MKSQGIALDIDNVLSATNVYWAEELSKQFGNPEGLTGEQVWEKYIFADRVPHWQTPEARAWMEDARNSNEKQINVPLIENANHMVNKINAIIPVKAYITARWESVRQETEAWLWKHEFPNAPVYMRPMDTEHIKAMEWKAQFLPTLYPDIVGIVDDDTNLIKFLSDDYPGTVFLYRNSEHRETKADIVKCKNWNTVLEEITKRYGT